MRQRLYVIKKYVMADSVAQAIRKEKTIKVDACWVDDDWLKNQKDMAGNSMPVRGFNK